MIFGSWVIFGSQGANLGLHIDGFWVFIGVDFAGLGVSVGCCGVGGWPVDLLVEFLHWCC